MGPVVHMWRPREWVQWCTCGGLGSGFSGSVVHRWRPIGIKWVQWFSGAQVEAYRNQVGSVVHRWRPRDQVGSGGGL